MNATTRTEREQAEWRISHLIHRIEALENLANKFPGAERARILGQVELLDQECAALAKKLGR